MSTILDYYKYAMLATAAYVRMGTEPLTGQRFSELARDENRLPQSITQFLFGINPDFANPNPWQILYYYGGDRPDVTDKTGLAATLFEADGEKVLAIRGVEPIPFSGDPFNDVFGASIGGIGMVGNAVTQLIDLVNLINRLYAVKDADVTQYKARVSLAPPDDPDAPRVVLQAQIPQVPGRPDILVPAYLTFNSHQVTGAGEGVLSAGEKITLTGHSLGGHLGVLAAQLLPNLINPDVYAFNSPGVNPITTDVLAAVSNVNPYARYFVQGILGIAKTALAKSLGVETVFLSGGAGLSSDAAINGLKTVIGTPDTGLDALRVHNLESEDSAPGDDLSFVASIFSGLTTLGEEKYIPTEANSHSIEQMMDALALHAVFYRLDDTLTLPQIKQFVDFARNVAGTSEEFLVESLHGLLVENSRFALNELQLPTSAADGANKWIDKGELAAREAHHLALLELNADIDKNPTRNISFASLIEENGSPITPAQIKEKAKNDPNALAYRYALKHGLPFAVIGVDYATNYDIDALTFYDASTNKGDLTDAWLDDIAEFYYWKNRAFIADLPGVGDSGTPPRRYLQLASGIDIYTAQPAPETTSLGDRIAPPEPTNPPRTIFGSDLPDTLIGGAADDRLFAGAGPDFVLGNEGDDHLEGGIGFDFYKYDASEAGINSNDGNDTILDVDGRGILRYTYNAGTALFDDITNHIIVDASVKLSDSQWQSADGRFTYTPQDTDLLVTINDVAGGSLLLKDWEQGEFSIRLQDARVDPVTTVLILGDLEPVDDNPATPEIELRYDALGNVERTDVPEPGRDDVLHGDRPVMEVPADAAGELFEAGAGNDTILADRPNGIADNGLGNADWISAGQGRDWVEAGAGNDLIEGGGGGVIDGELGGEVIHAGPGDDQIYSSEKVIISQAVVDGSSGASLGIKGDFSYGGAGDDWLVGSGLDDVLNGGDGKDLIVAGAGDDVIDGDVREWATSLSWSLTRTIVDLGVNRYDYVVTIQGSEQPDGQDPDKGGDDTVYAGAGSDVVYGRGGKDFIDAGIGDDFVFGGAGEDVIVGGKGNDLLAGDIAVDRKGDAADYIDGGAGNDILWGGGGGDILVGGKGNDILDGGPGADVYLFARGDGVDTFRDSSELAEKDASVFVFGDGITREDLRFRPGSLIIDLGPSVSDDPSSPHDTIYVEGFDENDPFSTRLISTLYFADGDVMTFEDIVAQGFDVTGTEFNDNGEDPQYPSLIGTEIRDHINGLAGDDVLIGLGGDDVLEGGSGADLMQGGVGNDRYLVDALDEITDAEGSNSIEFVDGTALHDVQIIRTIDLGDEYLGLYVGSHAILAIDPAQPAFDSFSFDDGTSVNYEELLGARFFEAQNLTGNDSDEVLTGHASNDQLIGQGGNDVLVGYDGDDVLVGGAGNDVLDGGSGDDQLLGGHGSDVYLLYAGSGQDQIVEYGESYEYDFIAIGEGLTSADVTLERLASGDLSVTLSSGDSIEVDNYYNDPRAKIEALVFNDGTVIDSTVLDALELPPIVGTASNDTLTGTEWADTIEGLAGDDVLIGEGGDDALLGGEGGDTLSGGAGNDSLVGGLGADVYLLEFGGEQDVVTDDGGLIRLSTSLSFDEVDAFRDDSDLRLRIRGTNDSLLVGGYFDAPQNWLIEGAQGEPGNVQDLLTATAELGARGFERAAADYETALKAQFISDYRSQSYQLTGDATLFRREFDPAYATYVAGTQTTTTTATLFNNPGNPTVTIGTDSLNNWSYQDSGGVRDATATLSKETIVSDDASISGLVSTTQNSDSDYIWASIDWNEIGKPVGFADRSSSAGFVYGSSGQVIGTVEYLYERFYSSGAAVSTLEELHPGQSFPFPTFTTLFPDKQQLERTTISTVESYSEVLAGNSDNYIEYGGIVDAGGGDDVVFASQVAYGNDGNDSIYGGQAAFGGSGADTLSGALLQSGGEGDDVLEGREEANRFVFSEGEPGRDLVIDSADFTDSVKSWYYETQLGLADWEVRDQFGGGYLIPGDWFDADYFPVNQAVADWLLDPVAGIETHPDYEWMSEYEFEAWLETRNDIQANPSLLSYIEPLPPLPVSGANDYAALLPLYDQGVLSAPDTIELPENMTAAALIASTELVEVLLENSESDRIELYAALDIDMGAGQSAVVVIPHAEDSLGSGVEQFSLPDGSTLNIQELLDKLAVAPASLDPQDLDNVVEVTANDTYVYAVGSGYEIAGRAGNDTVVGSAFEDTLYGNEDDDTLLGGNGEDVLYGGDGNDILEGGEGIDYLFGEAGDDTYRFGPGTERDVVEEEGGGLDAVRVADGFGPGDVTVARNGDDLTLGLNDGADRMTLDNWFGTTDRVEQIVFSDGTVLDEVAITAAADHTVTAVDDQVSLLEDAGSVAGTVLVNDFSSETGATLRVTNTGQYAGTYGVLSLGGDGSYEYELAGQAGQSLAENETGSDVFFYVVEDDLLTAADASLRVDITGQNDIPTIGIADITGSVTEDAGTVSTGPVGPSLVTNGDFETGDLSGWELNIGNPWFPSTNLASWTGREGSFGVVAAPPFGTIDSLSQDLPTSIGENYLLEFWLWNDFPFEYPGVETTVRWNGLELQPSILSPVPNYTHFEYEVIGAPGSSKLEIALQNDIGSWYLDDVSARAIGGTGGVNETQSAQGVIGFIDVDLADTHFVTVADQASWYLGDFDAQLVQDSTGTSSGSIEWSFSVSNADLAFLPEGRILTQSYDVTIDDGQSGGATSQAVTITIFGTGDGVNTPPVAVDDTIAAREDGGVAIVSLAALLANDSDTDIGDTLAITAVSATASGALVDIGENSITYDPGSLFQELREGEVTTDSFTYTLSDELGTTSEATVTVEVTGVNDNPYIVAPFTDQTATEEEEFAYTIPEGAFDDIDEGDVLTLSSTLTSGAPLPDWLAFDPLTGTFSGTPLAGDVGTKTVTVTATDSAAASASQDFDLVVRYLDRDITGSDLADTLTGGGGNDTISGGAGADTLAGAGGNDLLNGGPGNDTYVYNPGDGVDTIVDAPVAGEVNTLQFGTGITPDMLSLSLGSLVIHVGSNGDAVHLESFDGSDPFDTLDVTRFVFDDGSEWGAAELLSLGIGIEGTSIDDVLVGTTLSDRIYGLGGDDILDGGEGRDLMAGGAGDDTYYLGDSHGSGGWKAWFGTTELDTVVELPDEGWDAVFSTSSYTLTDHVESLTLAGRRPLAGTGNELNNVIVGNGRANVLAGLDGDDYLDGAAGFDLLRGGEGADILQGGEGADLLRDVAGTTLFDGGAGLDVLIGNDENSVVIGGAGADLIGLGAGHDILLYNAGDGTDFINSAPGQIDTLSLGGGIAYSDLSLRKRGRNLVLKTGRRDSVTLKDWYAAPDNQTVASLQVVSEAMAEFDATSADPLLNSKIQTFDFRAIVDQFDEARGRRSWSREWNIMDSLLISHLSNSDTEALGGDLAYQYGLSGSLAGISVTAGQDVLNDTKFGSGAQTLRPLEELQQGRTRLS